MKVRIFTLRFNPVTEGFDDSGTESFLADKEVLSINDHFFVKEDVPYITLVVCYRPAALPAPTENAGPQQKKKESWRELLPPSDWPLFNTLRDWRNELAKRQGIPIYVICNNDDLAEVVKARPQTLEALGRIHGFGEAKLKKYGKAMLALIAGGSSEKALETPEKAPKTPEKASEEFQRNHGKT